MTLQISLTVPKDKVDDVIDFYDSNSSKDVGFQEAEDHLKADLRHRIHEIAEQGGNL